MKENFISVINQMTSEYLKSDESKKQAKQCIIDFFKNDEEYGTLKVDEFLQSYFSDEDWQEIAKAVGQNINIVGDIAFTDEAQAWSKSFKHFKA